MPTTEVALRPVVISERLAGPWCPTTKEVGGMHFFCVDKWDRKLNLFCTGKGLNLRRGAGSSINCKFIDDLQKLRSAAADAAVARAYEADEEQGVASRAKKKARKAKLSDRDICEAILEIELPDVKRGDHIFAGQKAHALFGIKNHPVWLELTSENLDYVRHGGLSALENREMGRRWGAKLIGDVDQAVLNESEGEHHEPMVPPAGDNPSSDQHVDL
jgi:hypothetical protein